MTSITSAVVICITAALASAQQSDSARATRGQLQLISGNVNVAQQAPANAASLAKTFEAANRNYFLIQFS
ncbi:MAG: hypothetical protein AB7N71_07290, partial [Phycisphaerae bacterium]